MSRANKGRAPVIYQVDLHGDWAVLMAGLLSDMVMTRCSNCETPLLAEGVAFRHAQKVARSLGRLISPVCASCLKRLPGAPVKNGQIVRNAPTDYHHEEQFAALLHRSQLSRIS